MSEISRLFAKAPNSHSQTDLQEVLAYLATNGYKRNFGSDLLVTESSPAAMSVTVGIGKAWIEGTYYYLDAAKVVNLDAADGALNRIDRIVVECDYLTDLENKLVYVKGVAAAVPVAPALTRAGGVYQISLCQVYVGAAVVAVYNANITDERDDPLLCGVSQGLNVAKVSQLHSVTMPKLNGAVTAAGKPDHGTDYATCNVGDDVYFAGGSAGGGVLMSRYTDDVWATLTVVPSNTRYASMVHDNGILYLIGDATPNNTVRTYTISTGAWATKTGKTTATKYHCSVVLGGKIYCFGGNTGAAYTQKLEIFDIAGNSWSAGADLPSLPTAYPFSCCTDGTNIFVVYTDAGGVKFYKYVVATDSYVARTAPTNNGYLHYKNGYIWITENANARVFDLDLNAWTLLKANPGLTGTYYATSMTDTHLFIDNSKIYTYYYYLGTAAAEMILGFRDRTISTLGLINGETFSVGLESTCVTINDPYGIYVNDTTLTGTYEVEVYG